MEAFERFAGMLNDCPVIIIYRGIDASDCLDITLSLAEAGIRLFEVTMNTPNAVDTIRLLQEKTGPGIGIGAGTVTTAQQVSAVSAAGAEFIISPNVNADVIRTTKEAGLVSIPGAFTPTEIIQAWDCGADIVKVFPINVVGAEYIRQLRGPLQDIPFMGTGGVRLDMTEELFRAGVCSIGLGAHLLGRELVADRDWKGLQASAGQFIASARAGKGD